MKLYKLTKTGKIQEWSAVVNGDGTFTITHGQVGGKLQTNTKEAFPKNVGRSNETTAQEQAIKEVKALYTKQQDKGYVCNIKDVKMPKLPMLAHPYKKRKHNIEWPCYVQPKLDGVRCIAEREGNEIRYMSRTGKPYETLEHLTPILLDVLKDGECLDGEIFIPDVPLRKIVSLVKKYYPREPYELDPIDQLGSEDLQYWVYDMPTDEIFEKRLRRYKAILEKTSGKVIPVMSPMAIDEHDMKIHFSVFVEKGFEGLILRNREGKYAWGQRSTDLQKYKEFFDDEFLIVDAVAPETGLEKDCVIWVCKTPDGNWFNVRPRGSREERKKLYRNRKNYIGKYLTVRYQMLIDETNIPQFPVGIAIRDYE